MLSLGYLRKYYLYFKERLPILPTLLFSISYSALAVGLVGGRENNYNLILIFTGVFFFFLLRLRVTDEFKDENHDRIHYPNRPFQRGVVSKKDLITIGLIALLVEFCLSYLIRGFYYYLPVVSYSLLMSIEFFLPKFLSKHFTMYFLIHEVVFVFYSLFFLFVLRANSASPNFWLNLIILTCFPISIEIVRKFSPRKNSVGKEVADSYSTVWGRTQSLFVLCGLILTIGFFTAVIKSNYLIIILSVGCFLGLVNFKENKDKNVTFISVLYLVLIALWVNL